MSKRTEKQQKEMLAKASIIFKMVSNETGVTFREMRGDERRVSVCNARFYCAHILDSFLDLTEEEMDEMMDKCPTYCWNARKRLQQKIKKNSAIELELNSIWGQVETELSKFNEQSKR